MGLLPQLHAPAKVILVWQEGRRESDTAMLVCSRISNFVRTVVRIRPEERSFALASWLRAPLVELSLRVRGLDATLAWIEAATPPRACAPAGPFVSVGRGAWLVSQVYRAHFLRGACLPRSLLQYWLHRRDGTEARFVVGVRRATAGCPGNALEAHAWVEPLGPAAPVRSGSQAAECDEASLAGQPDDPGQVQFKRLLVREFLRQSAVPTDRPER